MKVQSVKNKEDLTIEVWGLGYVGMPLALKLNKAGFEVDAVDEKEDRILAYQQIAEIPRVGHKNNNLIGIICVPTPIKQSDAIVMEVVREFCKYAKAGDVLIVESSVEVGTIDNIENYVSEYGIGVAYCPERIDIRNPKLNLENTPRVIYCSDDDTFEVCKELYSHITDAELNRVSSSVVAEVTKSFENAFRLVNISLVNELAILCKKLDINSKEVIEAASTKPSGFMPFHTSAGAGGHCIPKDSKLLAQSARKYGMEFATLENAISVNNVIPRYIARTMADIIESCDFDRSVVVCGLTYKPDVSDMRDSPGFKVITELEKIGIHAVGCDPNYRKEFIKQYTIENNLEQPIQTIPIERLDKYECLCVVQNSLQIALEVKKLYDNSRVYFIYDCQNKIQFNPDSSTILGTFG